MLSRRRSSVNFGAWTLIVRFALIGAIAAGYLYVVFLMPPPGTVSVVEATSEQVRFQVAVPEMARLRIAGLGVRGEVPLPASVATHPARSQRAAGVNAQATAAKRFLCPGGILEPTAGTMVTYRRFDDGAVRILLERQDDKPVGEFKGASGPMPVEIRNASWLLLEGDECDGTGATRLPVNGIASLGDELRPEFSVHEPASAPLLEGTVKVFGRSLSVWLFGSKPQLYSVAEISLPAGSRLEEDGEAGHRSVWSGFAMLGGDTALKVYLTTEARSLTVIRPGASVEPETIRIDTLTLLTTDPTVIALQVAAALLLAAFESLRYYAANS